MLYFKYARIALKGQLSRKSSFIASALGQFFVPFFAFAGIAMLFARFGSLEGYTLGEALLCFSIVHLSFSLTECFARGFDEFSRVLAQGEFDRILVRPRGIIVQVLGARFDYSRIGRLSLGAFALAWSLSTLRVPWDPARIAALPLMVAGGVTLYAGIFLAGAALCFWTTDGLEVMNILTDGGREMSQYPLGIYPAGVRNFFTFVIPFGCVNWFPLNFALGRPGYGEWALLTPLAALLFFLPCLAIWRRGVRRYASTGS